MPLIQRLEDESIPSPASGPTPKQLSLRVSTPRSLDIPYLILPISYKLGAISSSLRLLATGSELKSTAPASFTGPRTMLASRNTLSKELRNLNSELENISYNLRNLIRDMDSVESYPKPYRDQIGGLATVSISVPEN